MDDFDAFKASVLKGDLESCKKLRSVIGFDRTGCLNDLFLKIVLTGNLPMLQLLKDCIRLSPEEVHLAFQEALAQGYKEICMWLLTHFSLPYFAIHQSIRAAAEAGYKDLALQLCTGYELEREIEKVELLRGAALGGHIDFCQYILDNFKFTEEDKRSTSTIFLDVCCENTLSSAKWLHEHFPIEERDALFYIWDKETLREICINGSFDVFKWLHSIWNFTKEELRRFGCIKYAVEQGRVDVLTWMQEIFRLTSEEWVKYGLVSTALQKKKKKSMEWAHNRVGITPDDVKRAYSSYDEKLTKRAEVINWLYSNVLQQLPQVQHHKRKELS